MPAFVGDHRFERKIIRIGIALERLCINGEQIVFSGVAATVLRASGLTVNVPILDIPDESETPRETSCTVATCSAFRSR